MIIHDWQECVGYSCTFHNPSDHHMVGWPKVLRESGLIERTCPHGVGHPDPDSMAWLDRIGGAENRGWWGIHGCDGCCHAGVRAGVS